MGLNTTSGRHADTIDAVRNLPCPETEIPVTPTHPTERVTVTHELPVPKSPGTVFNVDDDCHNDSIDCDLFPGVTDFRRRFISNFILAHLNINSYRHKYISIHDILAKKHVDYLAISESKLDASFPSANSPHMIIPYTDKMFHRLTAACSYMFVRICPTEGWIMPKLTNMALNLCVWK